MIRPPHSLASLLLALLFPLLALTGCASDGAQTPKDDDSWRTASQRVPDKSRRPSPGELAKQAKARALMADEAESESESEDESADAADGADAEDSTEDPADEAASGGLKPPIRLDPDGPKDRDTYVRLQDGWTRPVKIHDPQPQYNEDARKARIQGVVMLDALIDETGTVRGTDLVKGLPMGLTLEAYKAVKTWRFKPVVVDGEPVRVIYRLTVNFRLQ